MSIQKKKFQMDMFVTGLSVNKNIQIKCNKMFGNSTKMVDQILRDRRPNPMPKYFCVVTRKMS